MINTLSSKGLFSLSKRSLDPPLVRVLLIILKKLPVLLPDCVFVSSRDFLEKTSISIISEVFHSVKFFKRGNLPF